MSNLFTTDIDLPYIAMNADGAQNLHITLTRAKLEQIASPIVENASKSPSGRTIQDAGLTLDKIDKLILFGGMTKMPFVQKTVEDLVGKKMERGVDPMECVAVGASIQGAVLAGEIDDIVLLDVTPLSLGVETLGRRHDEDHRQEHHDPNKADKDIQHSRGYADSSNHPRASGRTSHGKGQHQPW